MMMRYPIRTFLAAALVSAPAAHAEPVKGVVELFTSQSCSSCPPADRIFGEIVERGGVIGLAFHVDYWNYLSWKDTFSSEASTKRQYDYAQSFRTTQVYTPQLIVNGKHVVSAGSPGDIFSAMDAAQTAGGLAVDVSADLRPDRLVVRAGAGSGEANIVLAVFEERESVAIASGENAGRTVEYRHAVTELRTIGMWKGEPVSVELPKKEYLTEKGYGCAILLQRMTSQGTPGEIIGAAMVSGTEG